jgi:hypothetical protein
MGQFTRHRPPLARWFQASCQTAAPLHVCGGGDSADDLSRRFSRWGCKVFAKINRRAQSLDKPDKTVALAKTLP